MRGPCLQHPRTKVGVWAGRGGGTKTPSLPQIPDFSSQQHTAIPQEHPAASWVLVREGWPGQAWGCAAALWLLFLQGHSSAVPSTPAFGMDTQGSRGLDRHRGAALPSISPVVNIKVLL